MSTRVSVIGVVSFLMTISLMAHAELQSFITMRDGYFCEADTGKPWVPHGIAYQTWNRPLGVWQTREQIDYDLDEMVKMGANSIRVDFVWQHIEEKGDNQWNWENYDYLVEACEKRGIRIFALIGYQWPPAWFPDEWYTMHPPGPDAEGIMHTNRWLSDIINYEHPQARAQYAEFFSAVCSRYKDSKAIAAWIVGNEYGYLGLWSEKYDGYDPWCEAAWRNWCSQRYGGNIANLNAAWGTFFTSFDEIPLIEQYEWKGWKGAAWADTVQWHEDSIASYVATGAVAARLADTNHLLSYSTVGMQWGSEDWRYHAEDRGKIAAACAAAGAPLAFFSINNYPWPLQAHESRNGQWGISFTKKVAGMPVLYSETGFTSSETLFAGVDATRQGILLADAIWESVCAGSVGCHVFTWNDRPYITDREKGFGIVTADRRSKPAHWVTRQVFKTMEQVNIHDLLMGSRDPEPDIAFLWVDSVDSQYIRYEVEMLQLAGAFERLGYEPNFIFSLEELTNSWSQYRVIVLPRNMRLDNVIPGTTMSVLDFLRTVVIPGGVHVLATADIPGQQDRYGKHREAFTNEVKQLFGIDASDVGGVQPAGRMSDFVGADYFHYLKVFFTPSAPGVLSNFTFNPGTWKWNDRIRVTDGQLWAEMDTGRNWGFEDALNGLPAQWIIEGNAALRQWNWRYKGANMLELSGQSRVRQWFRNVIPGESYSAEFQLRNNSDAPLSGGSYGVVKIEWYDAESNHLGTIESPRLMGPNNAWQRYAVGGVAPSNAELGRITVELAREGGGTPAGLLYVDGEMRAPAVVVKDHGSAKAAIVLFAMDFAIDSDNDGQADEVPMKWRYDILGGIVRDYFGVQPKVVVAGNNAYLCLPEYRTCTNGATLWQIRNMLYDWTQPGGGPSATFTISSDLFRGKTVRALSDSRVVEDNSDGTICLTLSPDGQEILYVFEEPGAAPRYTRGSSDKRVWHGRSNRSASRDDGPASLPLIQKWYQSALWGHPVVAGNRLYTLTSNNGTPPISQLRCYDAATGTQLWIFVAAGAPKLYSVAVADNTVLFSTWATGTATGRLFAVDAITGQLKWQYDMQGSVSCPVVENGLVYAVSTYWYLRALNLDDGSLVWVSTNASGCAQESGLSLWEGKLYCSIGSGIYCADARNGQKLWSATVNRPWYSQSFPVVAEGKVFVAQNDNTGVEVFDATTGVRLWTYQVGPLDQYTTPTVADGRMYIHSSTNLYAFSTAGNGAPVWHIGFREGGLKHSVVANGILYISSYATNYAIDAATGAILWSTNGGSGYDTFVANGWVFFGQRAYSDGSDWVPEPPQSNLVVILKDAPSAVHPLGDKCYNVAVSYDCRNRENLTLHIAFMEAGDNGDGVTNEMYQHLSTNCLGHGTQEFWVHIPDPDPNDSDYISTPDGGRYQFLAWLEDAQGTRVAECVPQPVTLEWGVRPITALPTTVSRGQQVSVGFEWENLNEYLPWERTPLSRAAAFPNRVALFRSTKTEAQFPGHFDRCNEVADWLESLGYQPGNPLDIAFDNVDVTLLGDVTDWGNTKPYSGGGTLYVRTNEFTSLKITATDNRTVDKIWINFYNQATHPLVVTVYPDAEGIPGSTPISSASTTSMFGCDIDLPNFQWTLGQTYHFVFSMAPQAGGGYAYLYTAAPASGEYGILRKATGGWTSTNVDLNFQIKFADGSSLAQPYLFSGSYSINTITGVCQIAERFVPTNTLRVNGGRVLLRRDTTVNGDLQVSLRTWPEDAVITSAVISAASVTTTPTWIAFSFNGNVILEAGKQYLLALRNLGTAGAYYGYAGDASGREALSWLGTTGFLSTYPYYGGWGSVTYKDLEFALSVQTLETVRNEKFDNGNANEWIRQAGAANWTVENPDGRPMTHGNPLPYTSYTQNDLTSTNKCLSFKITADASKTVDRIYLYTSRYGVSPVYSVSVYADNNGVPTGPALATGILTSQYTACYWTEVNLTDFVWTEGQIYHVVIAYQSGVANYQNFVRIQYVGPNSSGRNVLVSNDRGATWTAQGQEPTFRIVYTDGTSFAQPYASVAQPFIWPFHHYGQMFELPERMVLTNVAVLLMKYNTPDGPAKMLIRRWADKAVLATAVVSAADVPTTVNWVNFRFDPGVSLEPGVFYFLSLTRDGTAGYYEARYALAASGYGVYSWDGAAKGMVYTYTTQNSYTNNADADMGYVLTGAAGNNALFVARIGNSDNIMVTGEPTWRNYWFGADIRYNKQDHYFNDAELYVRYVDRDNFVKVGIRNFYGFWRLKYTVRKDRKIVDQGWLYEFSKTNHPIEQTWYNLKVECFGITNKVFFNNVYAGEFVTPQFEAGRIGVGSMAQQLGNWEPQRGYYFIDDDEYTFWVPEGQLQLQGRPLNLDWGYLDTFYPTLILPSTYVMSDIEVSNITVWLNKGLRSLIATSGGIGMKDETGANDAGRIESLFGVANAVDTLSNVSGVAVDSSNHYVTLDYRPGDTLSASGATALWPLPTQARALGRVYNGTSSRPALIANTITNDPLAPKKVFCFNFDADTGGQLTGTLSNIAKRALEWAQGEACKVRLELKYNRNPNDSSQDITLVSTEGWLLTGSGTNTLILNIPEQGIMTGDRLYWVMWVYGWDAQDPWQAEGGIATTFTDSQNRWVSLPGKGLQLFGAANVAYAGASWDLWAGYNTRGSTCTVTFGIKDKGGPANEDAFDDGNADGWTIVPDPNIAWSVTERKTLRASVVGQGGYSYITRDGLNVAGRNITFEYDVLFTNRAHMGGLIYRGVVLYANPDMAGWADGNPNYFTRSLIQTGKWHHITLSVREGAPYWMSDLYVDGEPVFLSEPIEVTSFGSATVGFLSPYDTGSVEWTSFRVSDEQYSFLSQKVCGERVPSNSTDVTFWATIPDYDPDWWEFEGTQLGGQYEWYAFLRGEGVESRLATALRFAPRLMVEDPAFPTSVVAGTTVAVPIEWEDLGTNVPVKLDLVLLDAATGSKLVKKEFLITQQAGAQYFPVEVPTEVTVSSNSAWSAFIYKLDAANKWVQRLGFDDTYRMDSKQRAIEPEVRVETVGGSDTYTAFADAGVPISSTILVWNAAADIYTNECPPEGRECWWTSPSWINGAFGGWGVFYTNFPVDLSRYNYLKFWVHTPYTLVVSIEAPKGVKHDVSVASFWNPDRLDQWQEVTIPLTQMNLTASQASNVYGACLFTLTMPDCRACDFVNENTGWVVGVREFRRTTNGGVTWQFPQVLPPSWPNDVDFVNENVGWVVGMDCVAKSVDGGITWVLQTNRTGYGVFALNEQVAWVCGGAGLILKTTNGGTTWVTQNSGTASTLNDIMFVDENNGWACGVNGVILRTTDGGATWTPQSSGTSATLYDIHFFDTNTGWVCGSGGVLRKTTDGGAIWTTVSAPLSGSIGGMSWVNSECGWIIDSTFGRAARTLNGGTTWSIISPNTQGRPIQAVRFVTPDVGYVIPATFWIYKTTNGTAPSYNVTWTNMNPNGYRFLVDNVRWTVNP